MRGQSKAERSDGIRNHVTHTEGTCADRTTLLNGADQANLTQHHAPSKGHYRGQKSKPKARILAEARGDLMKSSNKENGLQSSNWTGSRCTKMPMTNWRLSDQAPLVFQAFTAGGSKDLNKSIGVEPGDMVTHSEEAMMTGSPTTGSMRDSNHQDQTRDGDMARVQAATAVNILRASLKRIDPDLRAKPEARQNIEEDDIQHTDDSMDQVQTDIRNGHDDDEMRDDEGSDSNLS
ncbi:hypothetical protein SO802_029986 [Lithocarpus litseifolius]|uniref:Uncharacterized protein n=1 Tax=Lithocarpus litseifolius TaxID=425828 RepID=A0AAW2BX79_9ROSI